MSSVDKAVTVDLTETPHAASPANSMLHYLFVAIIVQSRLLS